LIEGQIAAMMHLKQTFYPSTKNMENNYCNVHLIISKCVLTHVSEGPSISRSSLEIWLKSLDYSIISGFWDG